MSTIPPDLLLDLNRLTVEVERLKSENAALRLRAERAEADAEAAKLLIAKTAAERDEARRSLVARWVITRQQSDCSDWTAGDVLIQGRIYADQCWGTGTGLYLFPEDK